MPVPSASKPSEMASAASSDVVRIAVTNAVATTPSSTTGHNHLMQLSRKEPLADVVRKLCAHWHLSMPCEDYALRFELTHEYVTDRSREDIRDGTVLKLCQSPAKLVRDLSDILETSDNPQMRLESLKGLHRLSTEYAMAEELVRSRCFFDIVVPGVRGDSWGTQALSYLLAIFYEVMRHDDLVSWEDERIDTEFIAQVASTIETEKSTRGLTQGDRANIISLSILESLACTTSKHDITEDQVDIASVLGFLRADSTELQLAALSLFNSLFRLADRSMKRRMKQVMEERSVRKVIMESIIKRKISDEMRQGLYVLQTLLLNLLEERTLMAVEAQDQKALEKIKELRKLAFDVREQPGRGNRFGEDYRRLGFRNEVDPTQDFRVTPPGMLALDMMYAFACHHTDQYTKLVLENSGMKGHECPFAQVSIEVTKIICELLKIGKTPQERGTFYPMFFAQESPLEVRLSVPSSRTMQLS